MWPPLLESRAQPVPLYFIAPYWWQFYHQCPRRIVGAGMKYSYTLLILAVKRYFHRRNTQSFFKKSWGYSSVQGLGFNPEYHKTPEPTGHTAFPVSALTWNALNWGQSVLPVQTSSHPFLAFLKSQGAQWLDLGSCLCIDPTLDTLIPGRGVEASGLFEFWL